MANTRFLAFIICLSSFTAQGESPTAKETSVSAATFHEEGTRCGTLFVSYFKNWAEENFAQAENIKKQALALQLDVHTSINSLRPENSVAALKCLHHFYSAMQEKINAFFSDICGIHDKHKMGSLLEVFSKTRLFLALILHTQNFREVAAMMSAFR